MDGWVVSVREGGGGGYKSSHMITVFKRPSIIPTKSTSISCHLGPTFLIVLGCSSGSNYLPSFTNVTRKCRRLTIFMHCWSCVNIETSSKIPHTRPYSVLRQSDGWEGGCRAAPRQLKCPGDLQILLAAQQGCKGRSTSNGEKDPIFQHLHSLKQKTIISRGMQNITAEGC